jgi:hypothetical protein
MKNGGPAFPVKYAHGAGYDGMSLRDWFAGLALLGLLIDEGIEAGRRESGIGASCRDAYKYADAMLEESKK